MEKLLGFWAAKIFVKVLEQGEVVGDGSGTVEIGALGKVRDMGFREDAERFALETDGTGGGDEEGVEKFDKGGFAGAVFAEKTVNLPGFEPEINVA